jgi:hypothetical protein
VCVQNGQGLCRVKVVDIFLFTVALLRTAAGPTRGEMAGDGIVSAS